MICLEGDVVALRTAMSFPHRFWMEQKLAWTEIELRHPYNRLKSPRFAAICPNNFVVRAQ